MTQRAKCRLLEDIADTQLDAATYAVAILELGRGESHAAMHEAAGRDLARLHQALETSLGEAPFFCGSYSLADIAIVPHVIARIRGRPNSAMRRPPQLGQTARALHENGTSRSS